MTVALQRFFHWVETTQYHSVTHPALLRQILMDDELFAQEVMDALVASLKQQYNVINQPTASERELFNAVHCLKSTVRSVGMNETGKYFEQTEQKTAQRNPTDTQRH